jgi:hypothetical protein
MGRVWGALQDGRKHCGRLKTAMAICGCVRLYAECAQSSSGLFVLHLMNLFQHKRTLGQKPAVFLQIWLNIWTGVVREV